MSKQGNHITTLTPELIEQYMKGELSHADMHEVEKLMLNSDFEAEAMEGFEHIEPEEMHKDLSSLQDRILVRTEQRSRNIPFFLKIAATLIILAVSTFLVIEFIDTPATTEQITQAEEEAPPQTFEIEEEQEPAEESPEVPSTTSTSEAGQETKDETIAMLESEQKNEDVKKDRSEIKKPVSDAVPEVKSVEVDDAIAEPEVNIAMEEVADEESLFMDKVEEAETTREAVTRTRAAKAKKGAPVAAYRSTNDNVITGKVKSAEDGSPLPGVNVIVEGTTTGTVTDIDGSYRISIPFDADSTLVFSFIGLASQSVDVSGQSILDVEMDAETQQLSEVVVSGYGVEADQEVSDDYYAASPAIGWSEYRTYLEENVNYPEGKSDKGKVVVKFKVGVNGTISNFEITKSMGKAFDNEAIRLIKEGPQWSPAKRGDLSIEDTIRIKVKFDPED